MTHPRGRGGAGRPGGSPGRPVLNLLGLAGRARNLVAGTGSVRSGVRDGKVVRVIVAADAAAGQQQKLVPLLAARGVPYHVAFTREELGTSLGRGPVSAVGLLDPNIARRVAELLAAPPGPGFTAEP